MKEVIVYSDGACRGNPGPGGWAAILRYGTQKKEISGGKPATTNNRMELQAAIEALRILKKPCVVRFYTDSKYLQNGATRWMNLWENRNWLTKGNKPVKNKDLWQELNSLISPHKINWFWSKGHGTDIDNVRCDRIARKEIANINRSHKTQDLENHLQRFCNEQWSQNLDVDNGPIED